MRKLLIAALILTVPVCMAQDHNKLWVHSEYDQHADRVYFIQDLETGTRCYAITNSGSNLGGYAISCVKGQ